MHADDILLYRPIRQASDYQLLQEDVEALGKWANNSYLTFEMQSHGIFKKEISCSSPFLLFTKLDCKLLTVLSTSVVLV